MISVLKTNLSIEFISITGERIHKTENLEELENLYPPWMMEFNVNIIDLKDYNNLDNEEPNILYSDTTFVFNGITFNDFSCLIYHILTESTIGANNIVTVIRSCKHIYTFVELEDDKFFNNWTNGMRKYLERL